MSFYKDKLEKYNFDKISPEILDETRKSVIYAMQKKYNELLEELKWTQSASRGLYDGLTIAGNDILEELKRYEHEIGFVSVLNTEDFFTYYKNMETLELSKFERKKYEQKKEISETLNKYRQKKGVAGKMSVLFGTNENKVNKYRKKFLDMTNYLSDINDAMDEFKKLSNEDVNKYIVGRHFIDNKFEFDAKEFEEYINNLQQEKQESAEPSNE